ncbi:hypothetical protein KJ849_05765 [bacterium]|nr:hypothetical protein [bacterium]
MKIKPTIYFKMPLTSLAIRELDWVEIVFKKDRGVTIITANDKKLKLD